MLMFAKVPSKSIQVVMDSRHSLLPGAAHVPVMLGASPRMSPEDYTVRRVCPASLDCRLVGKVD
jgi:hypothetical protein